MTACSSGGDSDPSLHPSLGARARPTWRAQTGGGPRVDVQGQQPAVCTRDLTKAGDSGQEAACGERKGQALGTSQ